MPSPFPGMDPYLEAPQIWPDLHDALAGEIRNELNLTLPSPYYARLEIRPELGVVEQEGERQRVVPDVTVVRYLSKIRHHFVEIRDPSQAHKLITLIEIVSPSNKSAGPDREAYQLKQHEVLESDANLIELDLLRAGRRILPTVDLDTTIKQIEPPATYLVLVNRAWRRVGFASYYQLF
jgi:Protein of unknown function (DUF4058)